MHAVIVAIGHGLRAVGRAVGRVFTLFRDDTLLAETYPEHYRPTGEQSATQGSVTMSLTSLGHG